MTFNCIYRYKSLWYIRTSSQLQYLQTARKLLNEWLSLFIFPWKWGKNQLAILLACVFMMMVCSVTKVLPFSSFICDRHLLLALVSLGICGPHIWIYVPNPKPMSQCREDFKKLHLLGLKVESDRPWSQLGGCMLVYLTQRSYSRFYIFANYSSFSP